MTNPTQTTEAPERIELPGGWYLELKYTDHAMDDEPEDLRPWQYWLKTPDGKNGLVIAFPIKFAQTFAAAMQCPAPAGEVAALREALQASLRLLAIVPHDLISQLLRDKRKLDGSVDISYHLHGQGPKEWANGIWLPEFVGKLDEVGLQIMQALATAPVTPTVKENLTVETVTPAAEADDIQAAWDLVSGSKMLLDSTDGHLAVLKGIRLGRALARRDAAPADVEDFARDIAQIVFGVASEDTYNMTQEDFDREAVELHAKLVTSINTFIAKREGK